MRAALRPANRARPGGTITNARETRVAPGRMPRSHCDFLHYACNRMRTPKRKLGWVRVCVCVSVRSYCRAWYLTALPRARSRLSARALCRRAASERERERVREPHPTTREDFPIEWAFSAEGRMLEYLPSGKCRHA